MKFKSIEIKSFRNFEKINLSLANKSIFLSLGGVGKINFLYALRYVFDKDIRELNPLDSDFHNKSLDKPTKILTTLDISNTICAGCQKLRAQLKDALSDEHKKVYVKLQAEYDRKEMLALPILLWGDGKGRLREIEQRDYLYELDYVFNVIYIDSYVDLHSLFKKNVSPLTKSESEAGKDILSIIQSTVGQLNMHIASLSGIKDFESRIAPEYQKFRNEGVSVSVKSEIAVKGLYLNIIPYIKQDDDDNLYPTAGKGRKRLLSYSVFDLLSDESVEKKINLFLVEEPENHLHKSMQVALPQILFTDSKYTYLFISAHSPFVLYEMNNVSLIRIYSEGRITNAGTFYRIPDVFGKNRKVLDRSLSEAIFADRVLLVEGPSEQFLFERILSTVSPLYKTDRIYILPVGGIGFEAYINILDNLNILNVIKTDNDLRKVRGKDAYSVLGFSRCNNIVGQVLFPTGQISDNNIKAKLALYNESREILDEIRDEYQVHLSKSDLEHDLDEILHDRLVKRLGNEPVEYLQDARHHHMVELIERLSDADCRIVYGHCNFAYLKEVAE